MKKNILFAFTILLIVILGACTGIASDSEDGSITLTAPSDLVSSYKSIVAGATDSTDIDMSDSSRYRINIFIEMDGIIISSFTLNSTEQKTVDVPSNVSLTIYAALYYAESATTDSETYNVYLGYDQKNNVYLMGGESKTVELTLNLTEKQPVTFYADYAFYKITGAATYNSLGVYFTMTPYTASGNGTGQLMMYKDGEFSSLFSTDSKLFEPIGAPNELPYFFTSSEGLYLGASPADLNSVSLYSTDNTENKTITKLSDIDTLKSFKVNNSEDGITEYYYLLGYKDGYLAFNYRKQSETDEEAKWSDLGDLDFSAFNSIYPYEFFLLDIAQDQQDDTRVYFASKIGLFYLTDDVVADFVNGDITSVQAQFKRLIRIPADSSNSSLLITTVMDNYDKVYLGTKKGIYYIDKTSSTWSSFTDLSNTSYQIYPEDKIKKLTAFNYNEPITCMKHFYLSTSGDEIVAVATPERVVFIRLSDNKKKVVSVFDGLPFIPVKKYTGMPDVNYTDYKDQYTTMIKDIVYSDDRFWFISDYGLSSLSDDSLF